MDSTNNKILSESTKEGEEFKIITPEGDVSKEIQDQEVDMIPSQVKHIASTNIVLPNANLINSIKKVKEKDATKSNVIAKPLSEAEMSAILLDLQSNKGSNCVQIIQQQGSIRDKNFSIAKYLQKNGYVISGRELSIAKLKGIKVEKTGGCSKLYIGLD